MNKTTGRELATNRANALGLEKKFVQTMFAKIITCLTTSQTFSGKKKISQHKLIVASFGRATQSPAVGGAKSGDGRN